MDSATVDPRYIPNLKQIHHWQFDHLIMPSEPYSGLTNNPIAKDTTLFIGIIVRGTLVIDVLKEKAAKLIEKWPVLGGKFITKVLNDDVGRSMD